MTKKIILYTEEGEPKRAGERVWRVFGDFSWGRGQIISKEAESKHPAIAYFHREENAEAYVDLYKPQFSKAEIYDHLKKLKNEIYYKANGMSKVMDRIKVLESKIFNTKK